MTTMGPAGLLALATAAARAAINTRVHDGRPSRITGHPAGVGYCRRCDEAAAAAAPAVLAAVGPAVLEDAAQRWVDDERDIVPWAVVVERLLAMAAELRHSAGKAT